MVWDVPAWYTESKAKWSEAKSGLPAELRPMLELLAKEYREALKKHTPDYSGGPDPNVLADLIRDGWHKWPPPAAS